MPPSSPNNLLVLNAGSSSLKFAFFSGSQLIRRGVIQNIGARAQLDWRGQSTAVKANDHQRALAIVLDLARTSSFRPRFVAHRIVHGGHRFIKQTKLTPTTTNTLRTFVPLAPLHLPANLTVVAAARRAWPKAEQWGVFDTALDANLQPEVRLYALPWALAQRWHIHKYGFHGISHADAFQRAAKKLGRPGRSLNAVTIHLGAGDSMTAWRHGQPLDTSMGFTPLEGLAMATRSGDLDPSIPLFLQRQAKLSLERVEHLLQEESGLYGLTGFRDIRDVLAAAGQPVPKWPGRETSVVQRRRARLAIKMFVYDIQKYLASYLGLLPPDAAIVFTGSAGQNPWLRRMILRGVTGANRRRVVTIPTDEESAIARSVLAMVHSRSSWLAK